MEVNHDDSCRPRLGAAYALDEVEQWIAGSGVETPYAVDKQ